jgi:hypothetical protein
LGWEEKFFKPNLIPYLVLSSSMDNLRIFLRFLIIPYRTLSDGFLDEGEGISLSDSFGLVLGWIGQGCGDSSLHDFVPPSYSMSWIL